jgi:hypothetical protein
MATSKFYKLTKTSEAEDPLIPGNVEVGAVYYGITNTAPEEGRAFQLLPVSTRPGQRGFRTSVVQNVIDANNFETFNSFYRLEEITRADIPVEQAPVLMNTIH